MKKIISTVLLAIGILTLAGCASHQDLKAPCPNFGDSCQQTPINSWNYQ